MTGRLSIAEETSDKTCGESVDNIDLVSTPLVLSFSPSSFVASSVFDSSDAARDVIRVVSLRRFFRGRVDMGGDDGGVFMGSTGSEDGSDEFSAQLDDDDDDETTLK